MADYNKLEKESLQKANARSGEYSADTTRLNDEAKAKIQQVIDAAAATVNDASQKAVANTNAAYGGLVDANEIDNLIAKKSVEQRLKDMGMSEPELNRTQETAMNLGLGNANLSAEQKRKAAVDTLTSLLDAYAAQSNVNKTTQFAGMDDALGKNILSEQSAGWQSAMSRAANQYGTTTQAEAQAAEQAQKYNQTMQSIQADRDIANQKIALAQAEDAARLYSAQEDEKNKMLINLMNGGNPYGDALKIMAGEDTQAQQEEINKKAESDRAKILKNQPSVFDQLANNSKYINWQNYGKTENGREYALQIAVDDAIDSVFNQYGNHIDSLDLQKLASKAYSNSNKDMFGLKFSSEELETIRNGIVEGLEELKRNPRSEWERKPTMRPFMG